MTDVRLYMLQTGSLKCKVHNIKMNQGDGAPYEIPVPWFFIQHPEGQHRHRRRQCRRAGGRSAGLLGRCRGRLLAGDGRERGLRRPAAEAGLRPGGRALRHPVPPSSRPYRGHRALPQRHHVVQRSEHEYAYTPDWFAAGGYIRADFDRPGLKWQFLDAEHTDFCDLYRRRHGEMIFTPGHAVGHQSILLKLPKTGHVLLTGGRGLHDGPLERDRPAGLPRLGGRRRALRAQAPPVVERTGAMIVTGHDPEVWPPFKKAPGYYD